MLMYPVNIEPDEDGFLATFPDIPEAGTGDSTREGTLKMAQDALITAFDFYFEDKRPVPMPSKAKKGQELVEVPTSVAAKILLLNEMIAQQVKPSELARRLEIDRQHVNRLIDLRHTTKIDSIAEALAKLGKRLELRAV